MKTLDAPKTSKTSLGPMLLGIATLAAGIAIARADKKTIVDGAGKFKDGFDAVMARAKPVRFTPNLHAVEPEPEGDRKAA